MIFIGLAGVWTSPPLQCRAEGCRGGGCMDLCMVRLSPSHPNSCTLQTTEGMVNPDEEDLGLGVRTSVHDSCRGVW